MSPHLQKADVVIVGGGLAGLVTALELLDEGQKVMMLEKGSPQELGGLALAAFGGIFLVGTREQKFMGIKDNPTLAFRDWCESAEFGPEDHFPREWARLYVEACTSEVGGWMRRHGVGFFPIVHWVEKGLFGPGNSVPRFHMVWGTGHRLATQILYHLQSHPRKENLTIQCHHRVEGLESDQGRITTAWGTHTLTQEKFSIQAGAVVLAAGGICGNIPKVKEHWFKAWGTPPEVILNGSHPNADGAMHVAAQKMGAHLTHLDIQWNYAAGVHHPKPQFPDHGLSLVPPKSALWMDYQGRRIGPIPLVTGFDTRYLVERICQLPKKYSWQILNAKIAQKELAVSGSELNEAMRDRKLFSFLKMVLLGNRKLVDYFVNGCRDFVVANSLDELAAKMNELTGTDDVDPTLLKSEVVSYDSMIDRGPAFYNDDQLRRIAQFRHYGGDKARTCKFQKIVDQKAMPLIAIREFILSRKSLGGIKTDLQSRVLSADSKMIEGLYAVGETAGFGGGGIHGLKSLEGTFLGNCILTARVAAKSIVGKTL